MISYTAEVVCGSFEIEAYLLHQMHETWMKNTSCVDTGLTPQHAESGEVVEHTAVIDFDIEGLRLDPISHLKSVLTFPVQTMTVSFAKPSNSRL